MLARKCRSGFFQRLSGFEVVFQAIRADDKKDVPRITSTSISPWGPHTHPYEAEAHVILSSESYQVRRADRPAAIAGGSIETDTCREVQMVGLELTIWRYVRTVRTSHRGMLAEWELGARDARRTDGSDSIAH
jgi:hypothetical protein